jgi:group II intron reverse transcriptase/maturase
MVYNSYQKVKANKGSAGIDEESIEMFDEKMSANLYKIWNRMASGSYFPPPVRTVFISKKQGGKRPLGIPTVSDRIAQGVVKDYLEPCLEQIFHDSSFGYRPERSAHQALKQCLENCRKYAWVIDVDIKGFFDNLSHAILLELLQKHTQERWVGMYVKRWLKAGIEQEDGSIIAREKGTPQGGVISPLLANLYLHYAFDSWMQTNHAQCPFERYADDIVIHCWDKEQAEGLLQLLQGRMADFELTLHPEKTRIVYCKNYERKEKHESVSFTFLGYSFQPRTIKSPYYKGRRLVVFGAGISNQSKTHIRESIREILRTRWSVKTLDSFAAKLNPKIRGWMNYYCLYSKWETYQVFYYLNTRIRKWIKNKYRILNVGTIWDKYHAIQLITPDLFYHWTKGIKT